MTSDCRSTRQYLSPISLALVARLQPGSGSQPLPPTFFRSLMVMACILCLVSTHCKALVPLENFDFFWDSGYSHPVGAMPILLEQHCIHLLGCTPLPNSGWLSHTVGAFSHSVRTARAQRAHSANYYGDYPGNNPENHPPAESCTINSKLKNSNIWCLPWVPGT